MVSLSDLLNSFVTKPFGMAVVRISCLTWKYTCLGVTIKLSKIEEYRIESNVGKDLEFSLVRPYHGVVYL